MLALLREAIQQPFSQSMATRLGLVFATRSYFPAGTEKNIYFTGQKSPLIHS